MTDTSFCKVIAQANDTLYGLAAAVHSRDISRAISVAHKLQAGTVWINSWVALYCLMCSKILLTQTRRSYNQLHSQMPFGGFKQ